MKLWPKLFIVSNKSIICTTYDVGRLFSRHLFIIGACVLSFCVGYSYNYQELTLERAQVGYFLAESTLCPADRTICL